MAVAWGAWTAKSAPSPLRVTPSPWSGADGSSARGAGEGSGVEGMGPLSWHPLMATT
ncbi:hypothetical protein HMPREF9056_00848 [Actinomyces sp. oral taxon 170 str. F0386]|nr:hypothetical protein HMPREF9056_00848 [Actinomyces sp. oral taxon 170 str. F0386]